MQKRPTHIIFDFDGVLVNSMKNNLRAWQEALSTHNVTVDPNAYYLIEGMTPHKVVSTFLQENVDIQSIVHKKEALYANGPKSELYDGIHDFLLALKARGLKLAVVSGGGKARVLASLKNYNILECFDLIVTADDVTHGKPHPEPYEQALKGLGCDTKQAVVIENAPLGIESAKSAGLYTVAVGSTLTQNHLTKADHFCSDHQTLFKFINHLLEVTK